MTRRRSIPRRARDAVRRLGAIARCASVGRAATACAVLATALAAFTSGAVASSPATRATPGHDLHVTLTLRSRNRARLAREVRAVSTPGSPEYRRYLTPRGFAARYGPRRATVQAVMRALRARGLTPGRVSAGGLSIPLTIPASALSDARAAQRGAVRSLVIDALPRTERSAVQAVIAFGRTSAARPLALRDPVHRSGGLRAALWAGLERTTAAADPATPEPCPAAVDAAAEVHANTAPTVAAAYGFDGLYAAGDEGQGVIVAVYELEPDAPGDIAAFQACEGTHATVSYVRVDGGAGSGAGSDEAALDIENLIGFAPRAHLLVYQGPNARTGLPGSGPYDVFSAIVNQDRARVVSVSWGQCEQQLGSAAAQAESELFAQAAVQGQTIVAAAGDNGAQDCDTGGQGSGTEPAVDDPAAQPLVLGVGGTTLLSEGPPPSETVWNSGSHGAGAGGGGVSRFWAMGSDQLDTPAFLHVRTTAARGPACGLPTRRYCREVPDVSADADPATGYEVYWNGADSVPEPSGWQALGGTSSAAPVWAALITLADASPGCTGAPLGFAGPALYRAAASTGDTAFHDVAEGENDFAGTSGARWSAAPGYDLASGLGTPDADPLVGALCSDSIRLPAVGGQSSARGAAVVVALHASDVAGVRLRWSAGGLPPGVRIGSRSGRLTGRPRRRGRYLVHVAVRDGQGARAGRTFSWSVVARPRLALARLSGSDRSERLVVQITSGRHAPWLRSLRVSLPAGVIAPARRASVAARHHASLRVAGAVVRIALSSPCPSVQVTVPVNVQRIAAGARVSVAVRAGSSGTSVLSAPLTSRGGA